MTNKSRLLLPLICASAFQMATLTMSAPAHAQNAFYKAVDFQNAVAGNYIWNEANTDFSSGYGNIQVTNGLSSSESTPGRCSIDAYSNGSKALIASYPAQQYGPNTSGAQWQVPVIARDEYFLEYRVKFGPNFQWVQGGKLPGLGGGTLPSGGYYSPDGFSSRYMWRAGGKLVVYFYWADQSSKNNAAGLQYGQDIDCNTTFVPDTSYFLRQRIKLNTPGQSNGILQVWVNNMTTPVVTINNLRFRTDNTKTWQINKFWFSTFFGGNDSTWAPTTAQTALFDDFKIWSPSVSSS